MKYLIFLFILSSVGCSTVKTTKSFLLTSGYQAIPLQKNAVDHFQLQVRLNGVMGNFILDTGASRTVIEKSHLKKFGISGKGTPTQAGGLGASENSATIVKIHRIQIGSFVHGSLRIVATDLSHVNASLIKHGAEMQDGVIGADLLKKGRAIIDYQTQTLYLKN